MEYEKLRIEVDNEKRIKSAGVRKEVEEIVRRLAKKAGEDWFYRCLIIDPREYTMEREDWKNFNATLAKELGTKVDKYSLVRSSIKALFEKIAIEEIYKTRDKYEKEENPPKSYWRYRQYIKG